MAISNAVTLANFSSGDALTVDSINDRVGIASTTPTEALTVVGVVSATSFFGSGSDLTDVISGVELKQGGSSVGTSITAINFSGATVSAPVSGLSTVTVTSIPTQIAVTDESSDTTCFPVFVTDATGNVAPKSGTNLTFNSSTGALSATSFSGGTGTFSGDVDIADKIVHTGDTNTAIRFPAADTFSIETGGSEALRVDSAGKLLVGTISDASAGSSNSLVQVVTDDGAHLILGRNDSSISDGDAIGFLRFFGNDGGSYQECAAIVGRADGTHANNDKPTRLEFKTTADGASSATERLRITSAGNVRVPDNGKFTCGADDDLKIYHNGSVNYLAGDEIRVVNNAVSETMAKFIADGAVELYHNDIKKLETTSTGVTVTGDLNSTSDINLKKDIEVVSSATEMVNQLRGVKFTWKENDEKSVGVIAQEVENILPELVKGEEGEKSVNYSGLVGVLIEAVKELTEEVNTLKSQLNK